MRFHFRKTVLVRSVEGVLVVKRLEGQTKEPLQWARLAEVNGRAG